MTQKRNMSLRQPRPQHILLSIDLGSSSLRCTAYEYSRTELVSRVAMASRKMRLVQPNSGTIHVRSLLDGVDSCIDEVIQQLLEQKNTNFTVTAIGFSSFMMNLVGVDRNGKVVGPDATLSYACNSEAVAEEVLTLKSELGEDSLAALYCKTGAPIHSAYALAQLRVLYSLKSQTCRRVYKWQTLASVCLARWVNVTFLPISYSEASWTGLLDYLTCEYHPDILDLLPEGCLDALPDLADFDELDILSQGIPETSQYFAKWPELRGARLFLGMGDGACANIGSKCCDATRIACTVGTSAAARVCLPLEIREEKRIRLEPGLFCYRIDRHHVLLGGALTDGGSVVEWISQLLNLRSDEDFRNVVTEAEELLEEEMSASNSKISLSFVPFLSGERSTGFRAGATGALLGLSRTTTPAHLFKACLEGVTLRLKAIIELLCRAIDGHEQLQIVASGKALEANTLLRKMLADSTGLPVLLDDETTEETSRGAAQLVANVMGLFQSDSQESSDDERLSLCDQQENFRNLKISRPRPNAKAYWSKATKVQDSLINAVSPLYNS